MNSVVFALIMLAIVVLCGIAIYALIKRVFALNDELKTTKAELEKQKANCIYLVKHAQELAKVETSEDSIDHAIEEAKTDEEVIDIINTVINANNNRVCK